MAEIWGFVSNKLNREAAVKVLTWIWRYWFIENACLNTKCIEILGPRTEQSPRSFLVNIEPFAFPKRTFLNNCSHTILACGEEERSNDIIIESLQMLPRKAKTVFLSLFVCFSDEKAIGWLVWDEIVIAGLQMAKITHPMEHQSTLQKHTGLSL